MGKKNKHRERQMATSLEDIRQDHLERYQVASKFICPEDKVLDVACGIGYGSYLIAKEIKPKHITAIDRSPEAIAHGKEYFHDRRISYDIKDINQLKDLPEETFDVICAMEILEHLENDSEFLDDIYKLLSRNGVLIISTPNQDVLPFQKEQFPYHTRHYNSEEFIHLLENHGFGIHTGYTQVIHQVYEGFGGKFNIAVCKKTLFTSAPQGLIKSYINLLIKEIKPTAHFFKEFGRSEARRLMKIGRQSEASYLLDKWVQYDKNNAEAWYLIGYDCENGYDFINAKEAFQKAAAIPITDENRQYIVSALFHLGNLSNNDSEKAKFLTDCLAIEPNHLKAKEILEELETL